MTSNIPSLIELSKCEQIICIQEHCLNDYEKTAIENLIPHLLDFGILMTNLQTLKYEGEREA